LKSAIYGQLGRSDEAERSFAELQKLYPDYDVYADLGSRHYTKAFIDKLADGLGKAGSAAAASSPQQ
jgi:hypothetical protein